MAITRRRKAAAPSTRIEEEKKNEEMNDETGNNVKEEKQMNYASSFLQQTAGEYNSYQEMVEAKRKRNMEMLQTSGLLDATANLSSAAASANKKNDNLKHGIKRNTEKNKRAKVEIRRSGRIRGVKAANLFVEHESAGRFTIGGSAEVSGGDGEETEVKEEKKEFYRGRLNDGSDLSIREAVEYSGSKWVKKNSVEEASQFIQYLNSWTPSPRTKSDESVDISLSSQVSKLSIDNETNDSEETLYTPVAKVTPDRIYAMTCHPSENHLLACAGDKQGHVGMWHVDHDNSQSDSDGVHLFKPHSGAVSHLEWNQSGSSLFSVSYDGTVREFDCGKETFRQVFATYDNSDAFKGKLGYDLDEGYSFWLQYGCLDHRNEQCLFLSTSKGGVMHVDLRGGSTRASNEGGQITFNKYLSEKKINTVSLHPNGYTLATGGLDNTIKLWDIRTMGSGTKAPKHFAVENYSKSVTSAFFSPSGKHLLSTTMTNHLNITTDAHSMKGTIKSTKRIFHNNQTGRWLSTFMARWHPTAKEDLFVVGSLNQPRRVEIFDGASKQLLRGVSGDGLTAVASRCCFHPSENKLIVLGGNSSGRVTVAQVR